MGELIWIEEAVKEFGVSRRQLFRWLQEKRLTRYRQRVDARRTYLDRAELQKLVESSWRATPQRSHE